MKTKRAVIIGVLSLLALVLAVVALLARFSPITAGYGSAVAGVSLAAVMPFLLPIIVILSLGVACYASIKKRESAPAEYISPEKEPEIQVAPELDGSTVSLYKSRGNDLAPSESKRDSVEIGV